MTYQLNLRVSDELHEQAKIYAKDRGFLNVQEFIRDAMRSKLDEEYEVRPEYIQELRAIQKEGRLSVNETQIEIAKLKDRVKNEEF